MWTSVSGNYALDDAVIRIPRRKRGFVGRNKFEDSQVSSAVTKSNGAASAFSQIGKQTCEDSSNQVESSRLKKKRSSDDFKEVINGEATSAKHLKGKGGHDGVLETKNIDSSLKKSKLRSGKRKDRPKGGENVAKEAEPLVEGSVGSSVKIRDGLREDDEENLEENAARMLSSRFDPSWTGCSLNGKVSTSLFMEGLPLQLSSDQATPRSKTFSGSESASVDSSGRVLRPRSNHKEKAKSRKRRHFYEISYCDFDAHWFLNRRIKVFWPLDGNWYCGLVNNYDKERELHHVKYDDRDEEWINLQSERFKLLLFPSEVPSNLKQKRSRIRRKHSDEGKENLKHGKEKEKNSAKDDDSCNGSYMDSEPIISWLGRSSLRAKIQKTSASCLASVRPSLLCSKGGDEKVSLKGGILEGAKVKLLNASRSPQRSTDSRRSEESVSMSHGCHKDSKPPIVYVRRRFHRTGRALGHASQANYVVSATSGSFGATVSVVQEFLDMEECDICLGRLDPEKDLWLIDDAGKMILNVILFCSRYFRILLRFPMLSVPNNSFAAENFRLLRSLVLLNSGTLMTIWPVVRLKILFVDNKIGLGFLLFEGCLKQVISLVFLVLVVFHGSHLQEGFAETQLPATSICFKIYSVEDCRKQIVFPFYNFHEVNNSKWMLLDSKLRRYCLVSRQLPLSECTYDNIKALQNGMNQLLSSRDWMDFSSIEAARSRRSKQGISLMGVSRELSHLEGGQFSSYGVLKDFPQFMHSFAAAPIYFLHLHLKLLMEHSVSYVRFENHELIARAESTGRMIVESSPRMEPLSKEAFESSADYSTQASTNTAVSDGNFTFAKSVLDKVDVSDCHNRCHAKLHSNHQNNDPSLGVTPMISGQPEELGGLHSELAQQALSSKSSVGKSNTNREPDAVMNSIRVDIPLRGHNEKLVDGEPCDIRRPTNLISNMNDGIIRSPKPTAPRSTWQRSRSSSANFSRGWSDGKADFFYNSFGNGPKKPRTQVSYSLPFGGLDYSSKNKVGHSKGLPHKRIRRTGERRSSYASRGSQRNLESVSCDANLLVTVGDRGWRECGVQVVLELFNHNEWKLAVKVSGSTRYSYKAHQVLLPGSTNRYTHAMMWKGGKDWVLEFPDRSQWALFKELHEECYDRNSRAASVRNIPIPGVHLVDEYDENAVEANFVRSSSRYLRQVEDDIEMALGQSRVLYDMDSDDERWMLEVCNKYETESSNSFEISEEIFEKTMDMFEKVAYTRKCDQFTSDEIEELMAGVGPMEAIKTIYEHWRHKRQKAGMPLIRHLQPPLWQKYQQQVKEWEQAVSKSNSVLPGGSMEKVSPIEKPAIFAFCFKPRGLEVPNKGSKQRSQKKISVSGKINGNLGEHDGCHSFGRRSNGFAYGDERFMYSGHNYESLDDSPLSQASPRLFSSRDMGYFSMGSDGLDWKYYHKLQRSKAKKLNTHLLSNDMQVVTSPGWTPLWRRNGSHRWNTGFSKWPSQQHYYLDSLQKYGPEYLDGLDLDELRLRDACSAAQNASKMARLKREKAQKLLYRADLAIHRAVVVLMTAEAMKEPSQDMNVDVNGEG